MPTKLKVPLTWNVSQKLVRSDTLKTSCRLNGTATDGQRDKILLHFKLKYNLNYPIQNAERRNESRISERLSIPMVVNILLCENLLKVLKLFCNW